MQHISTIAALALILGACSAAAEHGTTVVVPASTTTVESSTSTTRVAETTSTTAAPTTTAEESEIPYPDTSGDDWFEIVSEMYAFVGWLYENPDLQLVEVFAVPGSDFDTRIRESLREYVDNGWREELGGRAEVREVIVQSESAVQAVVLVIDDYDGATTVDATGLQVKEDLDRPPSAFLYTLELSSSGTWRFASTEGLGPLDTVEE